MLKIIKTNEELKGLIAYLSDKEYVAVDTETTGLHRTDTIIGYSICVEETEAYYVILQSWNKETQSLDALETMSTAASVMNILKTKKLIGHNFIFDAMMIESNFKVSLIDSLFVCTMNLAHLLDENRRVGLKELGATYFGENSTEESRIMKESVIANGGKLTRDCFELYKADAELIAKYGAQDALLTFKLFNVLVPNLYDQGLDTFFFEDETMPLLRGPTYQLNTVGLKIDQEYLIKLKKQLEAECLEAKAFIIAETSAKTSAKYPGNNKKNTFNLSSNQQLAWLLFGQMGLQFDKLTKEGKTVCRALGLKIPYAPTVRRDFIARCENGKGDIYQPAGFVNGKKVSAKKVKEPWAYTAVDKKLLQTYAPKYKWIAKLLELKQKSKILETYVMGIEERTKYGIINPSFLQHGTTSGRYSGREPNFQNLPRDDKRVKTAVISRPGHVFVGADYSQLEPRVFAYYSGDERLRAAFDGTSDFYSVIGLEVYGKYDATPHKEGSPDAFGVKYKKLRDLSKVIALASTYGATAHQLAPTTGKSIDATQEDMDSYFEKFPGVRTMMLEAHKIAKETGRVENIFGRPRRIPEAKRITKLYGNVEHAELPYEARSLLNLACNHRIQSTGASIVNRAMIRFNSNSRLAGIKCAIVCQVHDSIIVECEEKDAEDVSILLQDAMENTTILEGISLEALPKIGRSLADV